MNSLKPSTVEADAEAMRLISHRLATSCNGALRHVRFNVQESVLTLQGSVASWRSKQLAQEALKRVPGVALVVNMIQVTDASRTLPLGRTSLQGAASHH